MIPIRRGVEPDELRDERFWRRARSLYIYERTNAPPPKEHHLVGYTSAKAPLLAAQGWKCAYCEMHVREGAHVEHFRPKTTYFWLTWSWNNLLVSCGTCNNPSQKGATFPLFDPVASLRPGEVPPGTEQPHLLDPSDPNLNPVRHIQFRKMGDFWRPFGRSGDVRGDATIHTFGLDRGPMLDFYKLHLENLKPRRDAVWEAIQVGETNLVQTKWTQLLRNAFSKTQIFHALVYDVLDHEFSSQVRQTWGLSLQLPGHNLPPDPPVQERQNPAHDSLPRTLVLQIQALGDRPDKVERDKAILALCQVQSRTCHDIASFIERTKEHVQTVLDDLVADGRLRVSAGHYYAGVT